jgi:hypothetical protein
MRTDLTLKKLLGIYGNGGSLLLHVDERHWHKLTTHIGLTSRQQARHEYIILLTGSGPPGAGTTGRPCGREVAAPPPPLSPPALPRTGTKALVVKRPTVAVAAAGAGARPPTDGYIHRRAYVVIRSQPVRG